MELWQILESKLTLVEMKTRKCFEGGGYVRSWSKIICLESLKAAPDFLAGGHSFSTYTKFSEKPHSYSLIRTRTCGDQVVRNISFSENFAYVLNE